jgi:hypothetical protein
MDYTYNFKLTSAITDINLPTKILQINKMKISGLTYKTGGSSLSNMMIRIRNFDKKIYFDGTDKIYYTKFFTLPETIDNIVFYENTDFSFDFIDKNNIDITTLSIEIYINGTIGSSYVNASYPVFIELSFSK